MEDKQRSSEAVGKAADDKAINLIISSPEEQGGTELDLMAVFHVMAQKRYMAWLLMLCLLVGICAPLLLYQLTKDPLSVSTAVSLTYADTLVDPNGSALDFDMLTSSYVLQNAMNRVKLAQEPSIEDLRDCLSVQKTLTRSSLQRRELVERMVEEKTNDFYEQLYSATPVYRNIFLVTLKNDFKKPVSLTETELKRLLNAIIDSYHDYLKTTYADIRLPDDEISIIDVGHLETLESLEQLRSAISDLEGYCARQSDSVKSYRSLNTGWRLGDLSSRLSAISNICVNYLYSYINYHNIVENTDQMTARYNYRLRTAQNSLNVTEENIGSLGKLIEEYKADEVSFTMQESGQIQTAQTTPDYYISLVMEQVENYRDVAGSQVGISNIRYWLDGLTRPASTQQLEEIALEFSNVYRAVETVYGQILAHMEEVHDSVYFVRYLTYSPAAQMQESLLEAVGKNVAIGAVAGLFIALVIWFGSAFVQVMRPKQKTGKGGNDVED